MRWNARTIEKALVRHRRQHRPGRSGTGPQPSRSLPPHEQTWTLRLPASFAFALTWRTLLAGMPRHLAAPGADGDTLLRHRSGALRLDRHHHRGCDPALCTPRHRKRGRARRPNASQARQLDRMAALLDAVTVALIALTPDGRVTFTNRAARLLGRRGGGPPAPTSRRWALGQRRSILALPVGARQIVTMADGRLMLAWVGAFTAPRHAVATADFTAGGDRANWMQCR